MYLCKKFSHFKSAVVFQSCSVTDYHHYTVKSTYYKVDLIRLMDLSHQCIFIHKFEKLVLYMASYILKNMYTVDKVAACYHTSAPSYLAKYFTFYMCVFVYIMELN